MMKELENLARILRDPLSGLTWENRTAAASAIDNLLAARAEASAAVKVKALEWSSNWAVIKAETPIGHYFIESRRDGSFDCRLENTWKTWALSSDIAKADAQADYERRILSALTTEPAAPQEAEAVATTWTRFLDQLAEREVLTERAAILRAIAEHLRYRTPPAQAVTEAQVEAACEAFGLHERKYGPNHRAAGMRAALTAAQEAGR